MVWGRFSILQIGITPKYTKDYSLKPPTAVIYAGRVKDAMGFSAGEYQKGVCGFDGISGNDLFCQLFLKP